MGCYWVIISGSVQLDNTALFTYLTPLMEDLHTVSVVELLTLERDNFALDRFYYIG